MIYLESEGKKLVINNFAAVALVDDKLIFYGLGNLGDVTVYYSDKQQAQEHHKNIYQNLGNLWHNETKNGHRFMNATSVNISKGAQSVGL
jgi:hypothetical protein